MGSPHETILINEAYYQYLLDDINAAKQSIDLEVYIFAEDQLGFQVAEALANAAKRGVKVRVLVDGVGTPSWGGKVTAMLEQAGVVTRVYHPLPWLLTQWIDKEVKVTFFKRMMYLINKMNKRNHRKTCVIDHQIAHIGSANIALCHLSKAQGGQGWRDTAVRITQVNLKPLRIAFERAWSLFLIAKRKKINIGKIKQRLPFRLNDSWRKRRTFNRALLTHISASKTRIWITNAYFVPNAVILTALIRAAKRGIDVRILLPHLSDVFIFPLISTVFYYHLLKAHVSLFEYLPSVLHAKTLIIDDWYRVGSSNLNSRSFHHDLEIGVRISSNEAKQVLEKQFLLDLESSQKINIEMLAKQPLHQKILGWILLYLQYWF